MTVLQGLALLLLCQSLGEAAARLLHLPLPGPVLGLLVLVALLQVQRLRAPAGAAADALLQHLSLLFVPVVFSLIDGVKRRLEGRLDKMFHAQHGHEEPATTEDRPA